jgi:hypothetical protein
MCGEVALIRATLSASTSGSRCPNGGERDPTISADG